MSITTIPYVNIDYAKTHLSCLIDEMENTGKSITIAKADKPKLMIVPIIDEPVKRQMGTLKDKISILNNFDRNFSGEIADMFTRKYL